MDPAPGVWPCLSYLDAPEAVRFLVEAFGFQETLVVPGGDDRQVHHAELVWPEGGGVMLGSHVAGDVDEFASRPVGGASLYVVTDDPGRLYSRATGAGAEVVREMREEDYGSLGFSVRDPEGNIWSFGTYRGTAPGRS